MLLLIAVCWKSKPRQLPCRIERARKAVNRMGIFRASQLEVFKARGGHSHPRSAPPRNAPPRNRWPPDPAVLHSTRKSRVADRVQYRSTATNYLNRLLSPEVRSPEVPNAH